jgi:hypothetical protein
MQTARDVVADDARMIGNLLARGSQGLTFGFGDEIMGAGEAGLRTALDFITGNEIDPRGRYEESVGRQRETLRSLADPSTYSTRTGQLMAAPTAMAGEILGIAPAATVTARAADALVDPLLAGRGRIANILGRGAAQGVAGGTEGALYALGTDTDPATGAVVGAAGGAGGSMLLDLATGTYRGASRFFGHGDEPTREAAERIEGNLRSRGLSLGDARDSLDELGDAAVLGDLSPVGLSSALSPDVTPNLLAEASALAQSPARSPAALAADEIPAIVSPAANRTQSAAQRAADLQVLQAEFGQVMANSTARFPRSRATDAVDDALSSIELGAVSKNQLAARLQTHLNAEQRAANAAAGIAPRSKIQAKLTAQNIHNLRVQLDSDLAKAGNVGDTALSNRERAAMYAYRSKLNNMLDEVTGFTDISRRYSEPFSLQTAEKAGREALRPGGSTEEIQAALQAMATDAERAMFRQGLQQQILDTIQRTGAEQFTRRVGSEGASNDLLTRLEVVLGPDAASQIEAAAQRYATFARTNRSIESGLNTVESVRFGTQPVQQETGAFADTVDAVSRATAGIVGGAQSRRLATASMQSVRGAAISNELTRMLTTQDTDRAIAEIFEYLQPRPRYNVQGGALGSTMAIEGLND